MAEVNLSELACKTLQEMMDRLGMQAACEVVPEDKGAFKLDVKTEEAGRVIGHKGQSLEALELLLNRILRRTDEKAPWVAVEVDGYATGNAERNGEERRHGRLDEETMERFACIARDAAKEVKYWKEERRLGPYMPAERRIIHNTLAEDEAVTTESIPAPEKGERMKYVVVKLK